MSTTATTTAAAEITITTCPVLAAYTHARGTGSAEALRKRVLDLEAKGFTVLEARSARSAVPNSYKSAYKCHAPFYAFDGKTRAIKMVDGKLENRPKGNTIPAIFWVAGDKVPAGYRCFRRMEDRIEIRPA